MLKTITQLFTLLSEEQKNQFYVLQILVIIMAFVEIVGIASIAPFMALVGDIELLNNGGVFSKIYEISGVNSPISFLFYTGLAVLLMLSLSTIISMLTIWRLSLYGSRIGVELADRLYTHYMQQDWLFHSSGSSAQLTKQVSMEAIRVTNGIIQPLLQVNAKLVLAAFISISIFIYDPVVAVIGLLVFICAYLILYRVVRKYLEANGLTLSETSTVRFRLMNEGFGGIKDVLLLDRRYDFVERFRESGKTYSHAIGYNLTISQIPRYFMELIAFGAMIGLVLLLIKLYQGDLGTVLPIIAVYALAAFKLLPALQQIYSSIATIKANLAAFEAIEKDLQRSLGNKKQPTQTANISNLPLDREIRLADVSFGYPGKTELAVNHLDMIVPAKSVVGLVGTSGSGKSTTIDLLLGLLIPQEGVLCIDGVKITDDNRRAWQNKLGFVPQTIFLSEGSIAENVAFGLPIKNINLQQVNKALELANLTELVKGLPQGIDTKVGERGVQLSGGQRQRIGIARALYHKADVLVFDEATSALDGITEKTIMEAIHNFSGQKTIIMIAHRLKTVQKCDIIYMMEDGKIIAQGTYSQLINSNSKFKHMAEHS